MQSPTHSNHPMQSPNYPITQSPNHSVRPSQRHPGVRLRPGTKRRIARIVAGGHRSASAGQHIQVVRVIPMRCNKWVISTSNQHDVPMLHGDGLVRIAIVKPLKSVRIRVGEPVVVNLLEFDLTRRFVDVVLVRGIARPVARWREDLAQHQPVGGKRWWHDVDDLTGRVAATADLEPAIFRTNHLCHARRSRRRTSIRQLCHIVRFNSEARALWKVQGVRVVGEDVATGT